MGYSYYNKPEYFYCPKCGHKKLTCKDEWNSGDAGYFKVWRCQHNAPAKTWRGRRRQEQAGIGPQCDCVIQVTGRDAKIEDYGDVLHKMARITVHPQVSYLLESDQSVHKKGLEVLHTSKLMDVVRRGSTNGLGVAIYWRGNGRDKDEEGLLNPMHYDYSALRSRAARHLNFNGVSVQEIFAEDGYCLWKKDDANRLFTGGLGKRRKERIIKWALELEAALPRLIDKANLESGRWHVEEKRAKAELPRLSIHDYTGHDHTMQLRIPDVTAETAVKIQAVLPDHEIKLHYLRVAPYHLPPAKIVELQEVLGGDAKDQTMSVPMRRVTLPEAKAIHQIIYPESE